MASSTNFKRLLNPKSIAVIGGSIASAVIFQLKQFGYTGDIWPVNPKRDEIEGIPCFASLADLPDVPDAAFVAVPREITISAVETLNKMGCGGVVCYASGFAEVEDGEALDAQLKAAIGDMAVVGPNCYGVLNYLDGVTLWPDNHGSPKIDEGVAIVTQSGNISISLSMQQRALPLAYLIATGNQAGLTIPDYINGFLDDDRVTAIGLHIEGIDDIGAFSQALLRALKKGVPVVCLKTGASRIGGQVTMSHTSSLAGSDQLYDALFDRMGAMRVNTIPELLEALKLLSIVGTLPEPSIATISCSGGEAVIMADRAEALGLTLPPLTPAQETTLFDVLGDKVVIANPLDYHTYIWGDKPAQTDCFAGIAQGEQAISLKILDYPRPDICDPSLWIMTSDAFSDALKRHDAKGAVLATMQENLPIEIAEALRSKGVAPMMGVDECLLAIKGAAKIYAAQQRVDEIQALVAPSLTATTSDFDKLSHPVSAATNLDELESKSLLAEFGIPVAKSIAVTKGELPKHDLTYPLVAKILSRDILHKSDVGGVKLNLKTEAEVEQAIASMAHLGDSFLLEEMGGKPLVEMILGLTRDPQFGLALVVGAGGVLVELFKDSETLLLPVSQADVETALAKLKIYPLLTGYRGGESADIPALTQTILNLANFAETHADTLLEVDVNPLFVYPEGKGVLAVDGVIRVASK